MKTGIAMLAFLLLFFSATFPISCSSLILRTDGMEKKSRWRRSLCCSSLPTLSSSPRSLVLLKSSIADSEGGDTQARILFVAGCAPSGYGKTSPEPNPTWSVVATQLAKRLPNFAEGSTAKAQVDKTGHVVTSVIDALELEPHSLSNTDIVVALGVSTPEESKRLEDAIDINSSSVKAILADPTCSHSILNRRMAGSYDVSNNKVFLDIISQIAPWSAVASGKRLLAKTDTLLSRKSSEDYIFAILFCIHSLVMDIDVVKSDINPSWEKGVIRNLQEFKAMVDCCGTEIYEAISDPKSKKAIDLLNELDLRDQVGSYRVIVSNETPQLEEFTLCILQQNDCFNCDAPILDRPRVPLLRNWRSKEKLDDKDARQIFIGHLDHPEAHECSKKQPFSWKIVVGANPAYDAFPMQHQIFYPSSSGRSLWYDPVFCVETLDGDLIWCKRHYRCIPREHWSDPSASGAWTLSTLDNGMVSEEKWTTVDAADDLSWAVFHYSGAARRAGQSYVGALLCTPDGLWPQTAKSGKEFERIREAFRNCDLELWELFGGSTELSYMWSDKFTSWARMNPPPLDRIGDISITTWRKQEREKARMMQQTTTEN